ncbi:hypothetical protein DRQ17_06370 [bacterium]|nr:MAG: hypothetical protein DRQ17_06370 [bacterium]RKZ20618.1 MAG: hypothetical protein DRQ23_08800 [bacterium]
MFIPIPDNISPILKEIGTISYSKGHRAYLVGGPARDLILKRKLKDIDIMVEGNAIGVAEEYARHHNMRVKVHPEFLTAKVKGRKFIIDFASARKETYPTPGSLPIVEPGNFEEDMRRRDFTINAMAISITPDNFGELIDIVEGLNDLNKGVLRVMHEKSFQDDPTRILRGIRFSARFGFTFEDKTLEYLRRNIDYLKVVSRERILRELEFISKEGIEGIRVLTKHHIHSVLNLCTVEDKILNKIIEFSEKTGINPEKSLLASLLMCTDDFPLTSHMRKNINLIKSLGTFDIIKVARIDEDYLPLVYAYIENSEEVVKFFTVRERISPEISGGEMKKLGISPGPEMGKILEEIMVLRWQGRIKTKDDEIKFIKGRLNA